MSVGNVASKILPY